MSGYCPDSFAAAFYLTLGSGCADTVPIGALTLRNKACTELRAEVGAAPGPEACWTVTLMDGRAPTRLSCALCGDMSRCEASAMFGVTVSDLAQPVVQFMPRGATRPTRGARFSLTCS